MDTIFILEDNEERIVQFKRFFKDKKLIIARTYDEGLSMFNSDIEYEMILLDHDLESIDGVNIEGKTGNDFVLKFKEDLNKQKRIIIHSCNFAGAGKMKNLIPEALYMPFILLFTKNMHSHDDD